MKRVECTLRWQAVHSRLIVAGALLALGGSAPAGAATVFKCFDRNLGVLYTDQPCRGEQLDIDAGRPDPAALAELARERDALARSMAQRIADQRRAAIERDLVVRTLPGPAWGFDGPAAAEVFYPAYLAYAPGPPPRRRPVDAGARDPGERPSFIAHPARKPPRR